MLRKIHSIFTISGSGRGRSVNIGRSTTSYTTWIDIRSQSQSHLLFSLDRSIRSTSKHLANAIIAHFTFCEFTARWVNTKRCPPPMCALVTWVKWTHQFVIIFHTDLALFRKQTDAVGVVYRFALSHSVYGRCHSCQFNFKLDDKHII